MEHIAFIWKGARKVSMTAGPWCDKPCKSVWGVKIHQRSGHMTTDQQSFKGTCAEKQAQTQEQKARVQCVNNKLKNVFHF